MRRNRIICLLIVVILAVLAISPAFALKASTLCRGSKGEKVRQLQQALINYGYLSGKADGKFGPITEQAVIQFQKANNLIADGLAGTKTLSLLLGGAAASTSQNTSPSSSQASSASSSSSSPSASSAPAASSSSSGGLFGGDYSTIRIGDRGSRVKIMQQALISLKYLSGKADGIFGNQTLNAVYKFQSRSGLKQDGLAGKKTLTALETAVSSGTTSASAATSSQASLSSQSSSSSAQSSSASSSSTPAAASAVTVASVSAPDSSSIRLLHWFNDIKPTLKNGDHLLIYDPSSGLSWTLRVMSRGRHCDCEPLTKADTDTMVQSFGGKNTWTQHGVYVKLPSGIWTVGSTHDMPHQSGSIKDNGFDGHLCVHFLRNMEEAQANDPNYGVSNQNTIRDLWKRISGQEINY